MNYTGFMLTADNILHAIRGTGLMEHPGLENYLDCISIDVLSIGGELVSRQAIATAIETWFLIQNSK